MKNLPFYFCYVGFAFLFVKAYYHLQYDRRRRKAGALFIRWIFGAFAISIFFPIISAPNTEKERRIKSIANIALTVCYVLFALTFVSIYLIYGG